MRVYLIRWISLAAAVAVFAVAPVSALADTSDGRSPDTRDAAYVAHFDGRSPDTLDAAVNAHAVVAAVDLRSPDTRDAALAASAPVLTGAVVGTGGFDWTDAGIGAAGGFGVALILASALLLTRGSRRKLAV